MGSNEDDDFAFLLKEKKIHITQPRIDILRLAYNHHEPVFSVRTFLIDGTLNRISVHRALRLFVIKQILLKVPNTKGVIEYRLHPDALKNSVIIKSARKGMLYDPHLSIACCK